MSDKYRNIYRIPSSRLPNWDYSENGYYFVTICTKEREHYFGEIINNKLDSSKMGEMTKHYWFAIPKHFPFIELDEFIIMPNHIHGIIIIKNQHNSACRDVINHVSTENANKNIFSKISPMNKRSLGEIIRWYKGRTTFEIRKQKFNFSWQSRFYDQIIRNEKSFHYIRQYIKDNPINWDDDSDNLTSEF